MSGDRDAPELDELFEQLRDDTLGDARVEAVVEGVRSQIGGPGGGGSGPSASGAGPSIGGVLAGAGAAAVLVGAALWAVLGAPEATPEVRDVSASGTPASGPVSGGASLRGSSPGGAHLAGARANVGTGGV